MSRRFTFLCGLLACVMVSCVPAGPRATRPDQLVTPALTYAVPEIRPIVLPNGVRLYLSEDKELPLIRITGMIGSGSINDPPERTGQGELFAALLETGGAGDRSPEAFEEYLEDLAIDFSVGSDPYATTLNLSLLSEDLEAGLALLDDVLRRPRFDPERLELSRRQMLEAIRRQDDNPQEVAHRAFDAAVFGDHPFGRTPTADTVSRVSRDQLLDFHRRNFVPENLWLAVSGDFDRAELEQRIRRLLADWQPTGFAPAAIPPLTTAPPAAVWLAEKPIPQTTVMIGGVGISKDNPDLIAIMVMNSILGGNGFNSRLMREIRSNRGLAYSVYSYYMIGRRLPGSFIASGETKNGTVAEMVGLMLGEMERIRTEPVSEQELALAKESRINSFVFAFTDSHEVLTQQVRLDFYGYPPGYLQTYRDKVLAVTREDVLRVARAYLDPERMAIVLVGAPEQPAALAAGLDRPLRTVERSGLPGGSR